MYTCMIFSTIQLPLVWAIFSYSPDIVILNETWLKENILHSEILPPVMYKIFRRDRCPETHSIDISNPKKFRRNGGGVLIAVNNKLSVQTKVIPLKHEAEILAIEITLENKTKIVIATCYRVGTLGMRNAVEIWKACEKMYIGRRLHTPTDKLDEWYGEVNTRQHIFEWFCRIWYGTVHTRSYSY